MHERRVLDDIDVDERKWCKEIYTYDEYYRYHL